MWGDRINLPGGGPAPLLANPSQCCARIVALFYLILVVLEIVFFVVVTTTDPESITNLAILLVSDLFSLNVWFQAQFISYGSDTTWAKVRYKSYFNFVVQAGLAYVNVIPLAIMSRPIMVQFPFYLSGGGIVMNLVLIIAVYRRSLRKQNWALATMK